MPCPLPLLWGGACGRFGLPAPPAWGSVFFRDMVWLLPLVSSNVIVTCSLPYKIRCCSCLLANGAPVPALMRFSAPVKKHWLGSLVVRDRWEQGRPGARGREAGGGIPLGGGGGAATREHIYTHMCIDGSQFKVRACMTSFMYEFGVHA